MKAPAPTLVPVKPSLYMGFGMADENGLSLSAIRAKMIESVKGDPKSPKFSIPIIWRRRLDAGALATFIGKQISL